MHDSRYSCRDCAASRSADGGGRERAPSDDEVPLAGVAGPVGGSPGGGRGGGGRGSPGGDRGGGGRGARVAEKHGGLLAAWPQGRPDADSLPERLRGTESGG